MFFIRKSLGRKKYNSKDQQVVDHSLPENLNSDITCNLAEINSRFSLIPDLVVREFVIQQSGKRAALVYMLGLSDKNAINNNILRPLLEGPVSGESTDSELPVTVGNIRWFTEWSKVEHTIFEGYSVLFIDGRTDALALDTQGWPQRAIKDPQLESSLKGAHQGFVETAGQNIALVRRYIQNRELKIRQLRVGSRGRTQILLVYLGDVANPEILQELEDRITQLDVDAIVNSGELAEFIEDNPYSPFPQFISTERPDAAASQLLQGRIMVVVDGSPVVIIGPASISTFFQNVDDYGTRWLVSSFLRMLRFFAFFVALFMPSFYIALISYNYELIPVKLLLTIGISREEVPFPPIIEALMMEITLEMMRESGIRLPAPIGQTVGIVGGIVIGQTAVQAGIVSNIMVVIVAFTAIASFILPNYDMSAGVRLLRFPLMFITSLFGIVGLVIGMMLIMVHLVSLESLGTPYGSPFAPMRFADWKDTFIRMPVWKMNRRPTGARAIQSDRQGSNRPKGDGK
jgi:spore germination protein